MKVRLPFAELPGIRILTAVAAQVRVLNSETSCPIELQQGSRSEELAFT